MVFKPGDKVKRIDYFSQNKHVFDPDRVYIVESVNDYDNYIKLKGVEGHYDLDRFIKVGSGSTKTHLPKWF